jgi:ABC-type Fe3+ transport system substrate-binding protein
MQQYGTAWFDALLLQNPRWVRGTGTPATLVENLDSASAVTFTSSVGLTPPEGIEIGFPTQAQFVSWPQTAAILKDAPNPEGAKLLHSFMLSREYQQPRIWSVRQDISPPSGFPLPAVTQVQATNTANFGRWMADRVRVERLRFWFENRLGSAQGLSPLKDDL